MTVPFKTVTFGRGLSDKDKFNQMAANDEWLKEHMPTLLIDHEGLKKDTQTKLLAGSAIVAPTNTWSTRSTINFGTYFSSACKPVVVHSLYGYPQTGISSSIHGIGTKIPDHRGFSVYLWADDGNQLAARISNPIVVAYIAVGW